MSSVAIAVIVMGMLHVVVEVPVEIVVIKSMTMVMVVMIVVFVIVNWRVSGLGPNHKWNRTHRHCLGSHPLPDVVTQDKRHQDVQHWKWYALLEFVDHVEMQHGHVEHRHEHGDGYPRGHRAVFRVKADHCDPVNTAKAFLRWRARAEDRISRFCTRTYFGKHFRNLSQYWTHKN